MGQKVNWLFPNQSFGILLAASCSLKHVFLMFFCLLLIPPPPHTHTDTPGDPLDWEHPPTSMTVSYGVSEKYVLSPGTRMHWASLISQWQSSMTATSRGPSNRRSRSTRIPVGSHTWVTPHEGRWFSGPALCEAAGPRVLVFIEPRGNYCLNRTGRNMFPCTHLRVYCSFRLMRE